MDPKRATRISKFLSLVLRHEPAQAGLTLDAGGWVDVDALLAGAAAAGMSFRREELEQVVLENEKQRFSFSEDGHRIRANQGHAVPVDPGLVPTVPPNRLYHGTVARFLESIREEGLKPMARHQVHLSATTEAASAVGQRRGKPVILTIDAASMHAAGHAFFCSVNGVWLTDAVPPEYLSEAEDPVDGH